MYMMEIQLVFPLQDELFLWTCRVMLLDNTLTFEFENDTYSEFALMFYICKKYYIAFK